MTGTKINFKQERDFGDLFNATFGFISQEFKRLGTAILYFVVPFLLLTAIAMTIYSVKSQEMVQTMVLGDKPSPFAIFSVMGSLIGYGMLCYCVAQYWPVSSVARGSLFSLASVTVLAIGISRLQLGVHYPGDVVGGYLIGAA